MIADPRCYNCGEPLEMGEFAESWDSNGKVLRTERDLVCRRCGVRWCDFDLDCEEEIVNR